MQPDNHDNRSTMEAESQEAEYSHINDEDVDNNETVKPLSNVPVYALPSKPKNATPSTIPEYAISSNAKRPDGLKQAKQNDEDYCIAGSVLNTQTDVLPSFEGLNILEADEAVYNIEMEENCV